MSRIIKIAAVIDTICPWCFIGKRRMEKAMKIFASNHPETSFELSYLPFQLNPQMKTSIVKIENYKRKFGEAKAQQMIQNTMAVAAEEGIDLKYGGMIANTFNSHRLIWWSKRFNKQAAVVEQLFHTYFELNKDLGELEVLAQAASEAGLNKEDALQFLKSEEGVKEVKNLLNNNSLEDIHGVPHYIVNDKYSISGAQDPDTVNSLLELIYKKSAI